MKVNAQFLRDVFSKQPGTYLAFSRKFEGNWKDVFFTNLPEAIKWAKRQSNESDIYFCPTKLTEKRRRKGNIIGSKFLYSDLDEVNPLSIPLDIKPSHAWESSPGRYQCLWELDKVENPQNIEQGNKALAYQLGADKGGWDLTQVLRVPGTFNNKYKEQPKVKLLWIDPTQQRPFKSYPKLSGKGSLGDLESKPVDVNKLLKKWKRKIPKKTLRLLLSKRAERGKRSDVLWHLSHSLLEAGVNETDAFRLVQASVWNKYRGRSDEVKRLTHEIEEAKKAVDEVEIDTDTEYEQAKLEIVTHQDLMASQRLSPGWLVESFWTKEAHGIIAGEPKSFKSTFLLDFVISLASGKPFLGRFEVKKPGPVLVVQNENSDWIMRDRLEKIQHARGLTGKVTKESDGIIFRPPPSLPIHYINQQGFLLSDPDHLELVENFLEEVRPVAVMFDPLYLMFDGDVNSAKDLNPALSWLLYLKQKYQTAVILVHHWNKGGTSRRGGQRMLGSTTLHGWIESAWYLSVSGTEADERNQEDEDDDLNKEAEYVTLTLEREFRGAGVFPKLDLTVSMGKFGDPKYSLEIEKHYGKGRPKVSRNQATQDILGVLINSTVPQSLRAISENSGCSRKIVKEVTDALVVEGKIKQAGKKFLLEPGRGN